MNKRDSAIILEVIPLVSVPISYILVTSKNDSSFISFILNATFLLSFLGFAFFFIGRKLDKEDKVVKILGILDWLATLYVIVFYIIAIFRFGL